MASIDDVHNLLNAVNATTLKRMEDKADANHKQVLSGINVLHDELQKIEEKSGIPH